MEKTFAIFKPDCLEKNLVQTVLDYIFNQGLTIEKLKRIKATPEQIKKHYHHIINEPFYDQIEKYMTDGPIYIAILSGDNAINNWRYLMGTTNPRTAQPASIRGRFGEVKNGCIYNVVHGSDSSENVKKEIEIWFGDNK